MMQPKENYLSGHHVETTSSIPKIEVKPVTFKPEEALISQKWLENVSSSDPNEPCQLTARLDELHIKESEDRGNCPKSRPILQKIDNGWITPMNIEKLYSNQTTKDLVALSESDGTYVSCMTSDFAMQNLLLRFNLPLLSFDGRLITRIQNWVMRCHACFK